MVVGKIWQQCSHPSGSPPITKLIPNLPLLPTVLKKSFIPYYTLFGLTFKSKPIFNYTYNYMLKHAETITKKKQKNAKY